MKQTIIAVFLPRNFGQALVIFVPTDLGIALSRKGWIVNREKWFIRLCLR